MIKDPTLIKLNLLDLDSTYTLDLKKASLYHRFPNGKKEMTQRTMEFVAAWVSEHIIKILTDSSLDGNQRLEMVLKNINTFYKGGEVTCLFRALSLNNSFELFHNELQLGMTKWINAFQQLAIDCGDTKDQARDKAVESIVLIQEWKFIKK